MNVIYLKLFIVAFIVVCITITYLCLECISFYKSWIARDENGVLYRYGKKPIARKFKGKTFFLPDDGDDTMVKLDSNLYPEVTWENSPQQLTQLEKTFF